MMAGENIAAMLLCHQQEGCAEECEWTDAKMNACPSGECSGGREPFCIHNQMDPHDPCHLGPHKVDEA